MSNAVTVCNRIFFDDFFHHAVRASIGTYVTMLSVPPTDYFDINLAPCQA